MAKGRNYKCHQTTWIGRSKGIGSHNNRRGRRRHYNKGPTKKEEETFYIAAQIFFTGIAMQDSERRYMLNS